MSKLSMNVVVLAAGKGTRMKSLTPKVLHEIANRPMLGHVLTALADAGADRKIVVISPGQESVVDYAQAHFDQVDFAVQQETRGTADAVKATQDVLGDPQGTILIAFGDVPFVSPETFRKMHQGIEAGADIVVLGFNAEDPSGYGRLVVNGDGCLERIVEHKDASKAERELRLCNGGSMAVRASHLFDLLELVNCDNAAGEYYLPDLVALANARSLTCEVVVCQEEEVLGVNSRVGLAVAETIMQNSLRTKAMENGATLLDPHSVYFSVDTQLDRDVVVGQNVVFGPGVSIQEGTTIKPFSHLEGTHVKARADIGPYARLRPGTQIGVGARIGNFVETKKAIIEDGAKVNHLSYIGDARIGEKANIGAGVITCNYDGFNKSQTDIGAGAFIGSNSSLVAPVKIGDGAYVGSGSVVTKDVTANALAVARGKQMEKTGWAERFRSLQLKRKAK